MSENEKGPNAGLAMKIGIVAVLIIVVVSVIAIKNSNKEEITVTTNSQEIGNPKETATVDNNTVEEKVSQEETAVITKAVALPKLLDLGAKTCVPCKMMAPILDELTKEYKGRFEVQFIDVWKDKAAGQAYGIRMIPTQIFFDATGKELFRHEGFYSKEDILGKWKELGINLVGKDKSGVTREKALVKDTRPVETVCFMCERTVFPKTRVAVVAVSGKEKNLCSPHCYFIFESCLLDKASVKEVKATDYKTGKLLALRKASYLYGTDKSGRPSIKAFAEKAVAESQMKISGGNVLGLQALKEKENAVLCGFCDRAMYVQDNGSTVAVVDGPKTYGCCPHCALGVAARLQKDIVIEYHDPVSKELIRIETLNGSIKALTPSTAIAWFGQKKKPDGKLGSAGCFHQWNFTSVENMKKWLSDHPLETGRQITIHKALADKMKLNPVQIKGACKIGECK